MRAAGTDIDHFLATFFAPELRAWRGEAPLHFVFWVYGVVVSSLLTALTARAILVGGWELLQTLVLADLAYTAWVLVAIWRCTARATQFWAGLARGLTLAWAFNTILFLMFVEIELAARYASG
jgi:hypothetical protein